MSELNKADVFQYILTEEQNFKLQKIPVGDGWEWNFADHVKRSTLLKNSQYEGGNLGDKPFKNIVRPILNVAYRAEGFDVKDIVPFVNDPDNYYKSFLVRKFHEKWARKHDIDSYIDQLVESYVDYGGALSKNVNSVAPELVPLQRLAFCDQTNILGGPLCEKHAYGIDELLAMKGKWDDAAIDQAILQSQSSKTNDQAMNGNGIKQKTPGKYIEIYELHGMLPRRYLNADDDDATNDGTYAKQMHIVVFYKDSKGEKKGISLYSGLETREVYKFISRDVIYGRALGFGGIEELFESQIWINYNGIQIKEMLDIAAMMIMQTTDKSYKNKNNMTQMEKGQILVHEDGAEMTQVEIQPVNMEMFDNSTAEWLDIARTVGSANDPVLGAKPASGTPFALQNLVAQQNYGLHDWRQGKIAEHMADVYRDWVLPSLVAEMNDGQKFISSLSLDELNDVADAVVNNTVNKMIKEKVLAGERVSEDARLELVKIERDKFMKGGMKRFHEIMMQEFKTIPIDVDINIAGKQKDLNNLSTKLSGIFSQVIANPTALQNPALAKLFNQIIESAGMDPIDFTSFTAPAPAALPTSGASAAPAIKPQTPANGTAPVLSNVNAGAPAAPAAAQ